MLSLDAQLKINRNNQPYYAFSDKDICILLRALERRDDQELDYEKILVDPITLDDNSLELILNQRLHLFQGESALPQVSLICPIKVTGEFHWNLLAVEKDGSSIHIDMYDTNGHTKPLDQRLKDSLNEKFSSTLIFTDSRIKVWDKPGQKGVNCGLIVALMAHQLRLQSHGAMAPNFELYAGINPSLTDQQIRDQVSDIVSTYGTAADKINFCKTRPTKRWVSKLREITYDSSNKAQKQLYEACSALEKKQIKNIIFHFDQFARTQMTPRDMAELKQNLKDTNYAEFLFKTEDDGSQGITEFAEDMVRYTNARNDAVESRKTEKLSSDSINHQESKKQSRIDEAINVLVDEAEKLNNDGLTAIYKALKHSLQDCGETDKSLQEFDAMYGVLVEGDMIARLRLDSSSHLQISTDSGEEDNQANKYCASAGLAYALTGIQRKSIADIYDALSQKEQKSALKYLDEPQLSDKKSCLISTIKNMLTEKDGDAFLANHQADAVILAMIANWNGKGFLLADQPGVGKTRTMVAYAIAHIKLEMLASDKKSLIIVSNANEKKIFAKEILKYESLHSDADMDMDNLKNHIDIKTVKEAIELQDLSVYGQVSVDEIHSKLDNKSVKKQKQMSRGNDFFANDGFGVLEKLKQLLGGKQVLLASATAAKSLDELRALVPILNMKGTKYDSIKCSRTQRAATERMLSSFLIADLQQNGMMAARMLADSKRLEEDIDAGRIHSSYIESHVESIKDQHEQYNLIIRKINAIRALIAKQQGVRDYKEINAMLLAYIERLRESIMLSKKLQDAKIDQEQNPGHHILFCIQEYGDQKKRVEAMTGAMAQELRSAGDEGIGIVVELKALCEKFPLITDESLKKEGIIFNPNEISVANKKDGARIYVCSKSHLQGLSLNGLLTKAASQYREAIEANGKTFKFHLEIIGTLDGWDRVWQAMHRVIRYDNDVDYGTNLTISHSHFIREKHTRVNHKRNTQEFILRAWRQLAKDDEEITKVVIEQTKKELKAKQDEDGSSTYQKLLESISIHGFFVEMDFLDMGGLSVVNKIMKDKEDEEKARNIKKVNSNQLKLIHTGQTRDAKIYEHEDFLLCTKSAYWEYEKYLASIFNNNIVTFAVEDCAEKYIGLQFLKNSFYQKYLCTKEAFQAFDDLTEDEALALAKMALPSEDDKLIAKKRRGPGAKEKGQNDHEQPKKMAKFKPKNEKKRALLADVDKVLGLRYGNSKSEGAEKDSKKAKIIDPEDTQPKKKKQKNQSPKVKDKRKLEVLQEICEKFLNLFHGDTKLEEKKEQFKHLLTTCIEDHGYGILLERVKDGTDDFYYGFYYLCLIFEQWDIVEFCEQKRERHQSALGVLTKGSYQGSGYNGWSLLHRAVYERNDRAVTYLCDKDRASAELLCWKTKDQGDESTALHMAMANFIGSYNGMIAAAVGIDQEHENCRKDIIIIEKLVAALMRCDPDTHTFDSTDSNGCLPLGLVMNESAPALAWLLSNVDKPTMIWLNMQKEAIAEQEITRTAARSTEPELTSGEDSSVDQSSDDANSDEEQIIKHHQQMHAIISKKAKERKEKEEKLRGSITDLSTKDTYDYSDFSEVYQACRMNLPTEELRASLISILGLFVEALMPANKRQLAYGLAVKVGPEQEILSIDGSKLSTKAKAVKLGLQDCHNVRVGIQKITENQMLSRQEKKTLLNCFTLDRQENVNECYELLAVDKSIVYDLVLDQVENWALEIGYKKTCDDSMTDDSSSPRCSRLSRCYQRDRSDFYDLFSLLALHAKGEFLEIFASTEAGIKRINKSPSMLHILLGSSRQDDIDQSQVEKFIDIMIEKKAYAHLDAHEQSPLDLLCSRSEDCDFIYFLELIISRLRGANETFRINAFSLQAWLGIEKRVQRIVRDYKTDSLSSPLSKEIITKLELCDHYLESFRSSQINEEGANVQAIGSDGTTRANKLTTNSSDTDDDPWHKLNIKILRGSLNSHYRDLLLHYAKTKKQDVNARSIDIHYGISPLMISSLWGRASEVDYLIKQQVNVNETDRFGNTALYYACAAGDLNIVKLLIENGANIPQEQIKANNQIVDYMHRVKADQILKNDGSSKAFMWAGIRQQEIVTVCNFLYTRKKRGLPIKKFLGEKDVSGMTLLMHACSDIKSYSKDPDDYTKYLNFIIEEGSSMADIDNSGNNAMCHACIGGISSIYNLLLRHAKTKKPDGYCHEMAITNKKQMNLLHLACQNQSLYLGDDIIRSLIGLGVDINAIDELGNTPLMYACQNARASAKINALIKESELEVNIENKKGLTALMLLCQDKRNYKIALKLIESKGADLDKVGKTGETAVIKAARAGNYNLLRNLLERSKRTIDQQGEDGKTALIILAESVNVSLFKHVLDCGANPDIQDNSGKSALMVVCQNRRTSTTNIANLIEKGCNMELKDQDNKTALIICSESKCQTKADMLIRHGAHIDADILQKSAKERMAAIVDRYKKGMAAPMVTTAVQVASKDPDHGAVPVQSDAMEMDTAVTVNSIFSPLSRDLTEVSTRPKSMDEDSKNDPDGGCAFTQ